MLPKRAALFFYLLLFFIQLFFSCSNERGKPSKLKPVETFRPVSLKAIQKKYSRKKPRFFSPWIRGVKKKIDTEKKILVLTLDACGGPGANGYDSGLIEYLRKEKIPASLFMTGRWIEKNKKIAHELAKDELFTIENHGTLHRPASVAGLSKYGIRGTTSISRLYSEVYGTAEVIYEITGRIPRYYRPGTAYIDDVAIDIVHEMNFTVLSFTVAPGDAEHKLPLKIMTKRFLTRVHPGAVVLLHMNHQHGKTRQLLMEAVPKLKDMGYSFVRLEDHRDRLK